MVKKLFLTPEYTSAELQCRTLKTPDNKEWLGVFNAALLLLTDPHNWEQVEPSDLSVEAAIAIVQGILVDFFATETCGTGCALPDLDSPPFRLGVSGHFEMLDPVSGEWEAPSGEYEIPPVPERGEATAEERKCAAAANAVNVMKILYEAITDEIALGGDTLQVAAAMVAALVTAVGGWIAAPVYAIIQLTIALFAGMIELLQALGADVWTSEFDDKLMCALLACASDSGDVVTFELDCIRAELAVEPDIFSPTIFYEYQLFAQVLFLMETITVDGLNAAGATTAITDADCSDCGTVWCYSFDFTGGAGLHGWALDYGQQDSGGLYDATSSYDALTVTAPTMPAGTHVTGITAAFNTDWVGSSPRILVADDATFTPPYLSEVAGNQGVLVWLPIDLELTTFAINFDRAAGTVEYFGSMRLTHLQLSGTGENPFGEDNCEV